MFLVSILTPYPLAPILPELLSVIFDAVEVNLLDENRTPCEIVAPVPRIAPLLVKATVQLSMFIAAGNM